ncbi:MAG: D-alanyl-D-alanine carboxypeptidase/D-alanyl-D-alanine-endopeptidase, partial [Thiobacillus sp.]
MRENGIRRFVCNTSLLLGWAFAAHAELPPEFVRAMREAGIPQTDVAVIVQPVDSRLPVLSHRATQAMNPASVMKILTSVVALEELGPAFVWKTDVWTGGAIRNRTLIGDLIIKGYGDPTLTLERMWLLQREIKARGIDAIQGNLILDTQYFALPELDAGTLDGEPLAVYNALPSPLLVNYSSTTFKLKPVTDGVQITPDIALQGITIDSRLISDEAACDEWKE